MGGGTAPMEQTLGLKEDDAARKKKKKDRYGGEIKNNEEEKRREEASRPEHLESSAATCTVGRRESRR